MIHTIKYKKLYPDAMTPTRSHDKDSGYDLYVHSKSVDEHGNIVYGSGIAFEMPDDIMADGRCRSSNAKYDIVLTNGVGTIDNQYRGEVMAKFKPVLRTRKSRFWSWLLGSSYAPRHPKEYEIGDRFLQMVFMARPETELQEAEDLSETARGNGGYGSTGR